MGLPPADGCVRTGPSAKSVAPSVSLCPLMISAHLRQRPRGAQLSAATAPPPAQLGRSRAPAGRLRDSSVLPSGRTAAAPTCLRVFIALREWNRELGPRLKRHAGGWRRAPTLASSGPRQKGLAHCPSKALPCSQAPGPAFALRYVCARSVGQRFAPWCSRKWRSLRLAAIWP